MNILKLSCAALLLFGSALQAQPANMQTMNTSHLPSNFFLTKLSNGLEVLTIEDHNVPLATVEIVVKNGAFVQTPELEGLAHLYEHMFFKANKDYPSQEAFLDRVNELGIVFNGTTSNERVNYFVTLNKAKLTEGMQFINSAMRYPKFLPEEMKKENVVVAGEFQRNESNPIFFLIQDMDKHLWGDLFARKNSIGRYEVILNATPEIMQNIKDRYYYPNNAMLVVAGDVNHSDIQAQAEKIYGDWKPSTFNIWEKYPVPEFKPLTKDENFVTESDNAQIPIYMMGWHGPDTRNDIPSTYAADVLSYILQQKNSKFQKALVETGLAYQVQASYQTEKYVGPINVILVPNPQKVKEAIETLNTEITKWDSPDYFTDEQIKTAKEMLEVQDAYSKEKTSAYVHLITYWWASSTIDYYTTYSENVRKVSRQDIVNFIHKYIKDKPHINGILVSANMRKMINLDSYFKASGK
jgi:zinc protease